MTDELDPAGPYPPVATRSGEAPNLTQFMTRTTFAGAKFDLRQSPGTDASA